jgi:hypothetical protein
MHTVHTARFTAAARAARAVAAAALLLAFALAPAQTTAAATTAATPNWTGDPAAGTGELEQMWQIIRDAKADPAGARPVSLRGIFRFALEAAGLPPAGWHPERVEAALELTRTMQDSDPASPTRGNFRWGSNQDKIHDLNAAEFAAQLMGFLHHNYADRLTPRARALLDEQMTGALHALAARKVRIEYTNIYVMKCWGLVALGEALGRADAADDGYRRFDQWLAHTARNGIAEYDTPTYYGVVLDSLQMLARHAGRQAAREKAAKAIRYLWADAAANWWKPGDRLAGANARSYDYTHAHGYFELHTWPSGWLRRRPQIEGAGWPPGPRANLSAMLDAVCLPAPAALVQPLLDEIPRTVVQRWGEGPGRIATDYIGRRVSLGTSGHENGRDDRNLVINLGDSPAIPQMILFMDGRGDPYGTKKTANAAAQAKALHLVPFVATVQRGPEALQLLSADPLGPGSPNRRDTLRCFLTHLTIPAAATIWIDGVRVEPGTPKEPLLLDLKPGTVVSARLGDAIAALRLLHADVTPGETWTRPQIRLIEDKKGDETRRLTIVHDRNAPRGRATIVAWLRVAEGLDDAGFARFRRDFAAAAAAVARDGGTFRAAAAGLAGELRIEADVVKRARHILAGAEPRPALLTVNGREVGREILGEFADAEP